MMGEFRTVMRGMTMTSTRHRMPGPRGHELALLLDLPALAPRGFVLFAHCFTCSKDSKGAAYIARALAESGFGVLRLDFTGIGDSDGDFTQANFSTDVDDLVAAADWLREHHGAPDIVIGHSLGGAAVLAGASRIADVRAVVVVGAPFDPGHLREQFSHHLDLIESEGSAELQLGDKRLTITSAFLDDLENQDQASRIHALRLPLLILHAPLDKTVGIDNARRIFEAAMHPKSFVALDGADHLLSRADDARYVASVVAAWAGRYLAATDDQIASPPVGLVRVRERGTGKFTNVVSAGAHTLLADEPASVGGDDLGLNPYELLQAALGACTTMTLRMYADLKKLPLHRVSVDLHHEKVHAEDCADCDKTAAKIDRIERVITLEGDLDEAQRDRLLAIADKCPVHRTLHGTIEVRTRLVDSDVT